MKKHVSPIICKAFFLREDLDRNHGIFSWKAPQQILADSSDIGDDNNNALTAFRTHPPFQLKCSETKPIILNCLPIYIMQKVLKIEATTLINRDRDEPGYLIKYSQSNTERLCGTNVQSLCKIIHNRYVSKSWLPFISLNMEKVTQSIIYTMLDATIRAPVLTIPGVWSLVLVPWIEKWKEANSWQDSEH